MQIPYREEEVDLPAGWSSAVDPESGAEYYIHADSGHTQWEVPERDSR